MKPAQQLALWADQLRSLALLGIHYATDVYQRARYQQVQKIAWEMLALATGETLEALDPLGAPALTRPGPYAVGDAAIIDGAGRILLIRRADNHLWAMPGGGFDNGETPAQGAVREALEEAGLYCEPVSLVGVFDSRLCGTKSRHHLYQFVFLCKPVDRPPLAEPSHGHEVIETGWFAEPELPTELDPGHASRIPVAFQVWRGERGAYFDNYSSAPTEPILNT
jgi:8-oxo-dGTP pyrophosphatase MutT (NUDIX family)